MDQFRAAKVAENGGDFTALAADDGGRFGMPIGGEAAADLHALAVPDDHGIAALELAFDARDASRQEALARPERRRRATVHDERAARLQRAADPALARRSGVRARQEPGADTRGRK